MFFKKKKSVAVLGSTGSIGKTSLSIIKKNLKFLRIDLLSARSNKHLLLKQIKTYLPRYVIINDEKNFYFFQKLTFKKKIKFFLNVHDFNKYNKNKKIKFQKTILGISSINGLDYGFAFLNFSEEILIANKETIICGGKLFLNLAKKKKCKITSIDSEHFCLANLLSFVKKKEIDNVYITASGGPFLNKRNDQISKIDPKLALNHPSWKMGEKISIDSSTMSNKALEVMEASILFDINPNKIKIKIHKECKVHAIIIMKNGLTYFASHNTSMKIPIENSLINHNRILNQKNFFLEKKTFNLSFDEINLKNYKIIPLAYKALKYGQRACIFFNVINDNLVNLYLNRKIFFYQISEKLNKVINDKKLLKLFKKKINKRKDIYDTIQFPKVFSKTI